MKIVVVMPFDETFDRVHETIKAAVSQALPGTKCVRVDEDFDAGRRIHSVIEQHLRSADIGIADITRLHSNVLWEIGFLEARQKPVIAICQTPLPTLPFNIGDLKVLPYTIEWLDETLVNPLTVAIQQTSVARAAQYARQTITIVGSTDVNIGDAESMVERLATPYLGPDTEWYCGTDSNVSLAVARFLLRKEQHLTAVYTSDRSVLPEIEALFTDYRTAPPVNVDDVVLPGQSRNHAENMGLEKRNLFLATKSDLVILIWDGSSVNTGKLHDWLLSNRRRHLIGYVAGRDASEQK